jgi:hypothetical protein
MGAHGPKEIPGVALNASQVFLNPSGSWTPSQLVLAPDANVDHRGDVLVSEGFQRELFQEANLECGAEACSVFGRGDDDNQRIKALQVRHRLGKNLGQVLSVEHGEVEHNQGLPMVPTQRLNQHVRGLTWP